MKVCRASDERLDPDHAKTLMTRPMLTPGAIREALQEATKVSLDL